MEESAVRKRYISANEYLEDIWRLAARVRAGGWRPDIIIALWRGGAPVGIAVHEYLKATGWDIEHIPLKCGSYSGIGRNTANVAFTHGEAVFGMLHPGMKALVIDDVFDTGKTAVAVKTRVEAAGAAFRIACVYFKPLKNTTSITPDYFARDVSSEWIVFPHEIVGLSPDEIHEKSPALAEIMGGTSFCSSLPLPPNPQLPTPNCYLPTANYFRPPH